MSGAVLGLPKKLLPEPSVVMSPECMSQMTRIFPNNVSSVASPATVMSFNGTFNNLPQNVQEVRFSIPTGQGRGVFIDSSKSRLNFRVRVAATVASTGADTTSTFLQSSALSYFDRSQTFNANGVAIDDIVGLAQVNCHRNNYQYNSAERDSAWSMGFRGEDELVDSRNFLQGHSIPALSPTGAVIGVTAAGVGFFDYSVPLPSSLLGPDAKNFCPVGALAALNMSLWTGNVLPIVYQNTATTTVGATVQAVIDHISIDLQYIYLDAKSQAMLNLGKEFYIHSITHRLSTGTIAAATEGQVSVLIGLRGRSVRSLSTRFTESNVTTAGCCNKSFDSKMLPATQMNYFINGKTRVPNVPHNSVNAPSTIFEHSLQAAGAFTAHDVKYGGQYTSFASVVDGTAASPNLSQWGRSAGTDSFSGSLLSFNMSEDLRVASTSQILDGMDLSTSSSHYLELAIPTGPTYSLTTSFISANDIIYIVDLESGNIESRV